MLEITASRVTAFESGGGVHCANWIQKAITPSAFFFSQR
jgi:hypothetical protein